MCGCCLHWASHSASRNSRECDGESRQYVHPHAHTHIHTLLVSTLMRTLRMAQGTKSAYVICHFSLASCRSFFLLIFPLQCHSRARCVHHQHLLLRLQRLPRPTARIRQRSPCASACHWRESGPLTDFAMHNPTAFLEHPHEFSCSDNVTMIPATQVLPVASRGPNVFGLISTRKPVCECHLSVLHKQRETGADVEKESVATTIFSPTSKGKRDRDKKCCAVVERQGESSKNLGTES